MLIRLFTSKCAFYVGDSTAKVVNSEQITTVLPTNHACIVQRMLMEAYD